MTGDLDIARLNAVLRQDFGSFLRKAFHTLSPGQEYVRGWHLDAIVHRLQQVHIGETKRLVINMPPRSLKSIAASVALPAFILGHDPTRRINCVSYSTDLAKKHSNDFRAIIESDWYCKLFPQTR